MRTVVMPFAKPTEIPMLGSLDESPLPLTTKQVVNVYYVVNHNKSSYVAFLSYIVHLVVAN